MKKRSRGKKRKKRLKARSKASRSVSIQSVASVTKDDVAPVVIDNSGVFDEKKKVTLLDSDDFVSLEKAKEYWSLGGWEKLVAFDLDFLQRHSDRGQLVLLIGGAYLQLGNIDKGKEYVWLALKLGCSWNEMAKVLITGADEILKRMFALKGEKNFRDNYFMEDSYSIEEIKRLGKALETEKLSNYKKKILGIEKELNHAKKGLSLSRKINLLRKNDLDALQEHYKLVLSLQEQKVVLPPVRTVHHFACTGGTLISKCVAALPNVQLLSEIDPLSNLLDQKDIKRFAPSDVILSMKQSTKGASSNLLIDIFQQELAVIYSNSRAIGQHLVLRDHAHSHFCHGDTIIKRLNLLEIVKDKFPVLSLVTVRNPIDSYLSLKKNGWVHFSPKTFDEYCRRYLVFIESYRSVPFIRYEDFVENSHDVMKKISEILDLKYTKHFQYLFDVFTLTGDSGRKGNRIISRPRREISNEFQKEINTSASFLKLSKRLGY